MFRSGFIAIIGCPNVGKSTILNALVGQKVAIVSKRAQTTRNRIMGVVTREDYQMVFLDTPGVHTPRNRLGEYMVKVAYDSLDEVECILFVADAAMGIMERDERLLERLKITKTPVIAALNKIDITTPDRFKIAYDRLSSEAWLDKLIPVSALENNGIDALEAALSAHLVEGPKYFPDDMVTDQPERVVCAELVREKALQLLEKEVPHGIGVDIDKMEVRPERRIVDVWATIYCERDSHKGIIIGKNGEMLRRIGQLARKDMEWMLGMQVNLQLWVKVKSDWRNKLSVMRELGYE
jgi:GTP-binding protein Era